MHLEFHSAGDLSQPLLREVIAFLDGQNTSHIFQFPQWNAPNGSCALLRDDGVIRWFAAFGVHTPVGRAWPWMRAVISDRGPVCDDQSLWYGATEECANQLSLEHYSYFDVVPDWVQAPGENDFCNFSWSSLAAERFSLRVNLNDSEDALFARIRKSSRYEVRRAERLRVSVAPAVADSEIEAFLKLHSDLAIRKGFAGESRHHIRSVARWLISDAERGALLLARAEDAVCGGAVIARSGKRCWYLWGATGQNDRYNVGHILQWKAMLWAKAHGCDQYDFGGYAPESKAGPAWFKAGFGGDMVRFVPPRRRVFRHGYYRIFQVASRIRRYSMRAPSKVEIARQAC